MTFDPNRAAQIDNQSDDFLSYESFSFRSVLADSWFSNWDEKQEYVFTTTHISNVVCTIAAQGRTCKYV